MVTPPTAPTGDYVLYADRRRMLRNLNTRMLLICLPLVLLAFAAVGVLSGAAPPPPSGPPSGRLPAPLDLHATLGWLPWFLVAELVVLWLASVASHLRQVKPIVTLGPRGLAVDTMATHLGELSWDEVGEVRCYTMIYRYVGIVPRDTSALCRRLGPRRAWLLWMNAACIPLYRIFGIFLAPINIPQVYLPIRADELAATIRAYQVAYGPTRAGGRGEAPWQPEGGVWPPPPSTLRG